ncbi:hypothetical protein I2I05_08675 [Hymenobacter sp. BT683]|uniref:Uncharacterized protein n=1 Tax=Hymenobacter jeongseonensis TaxID=2791027 RepID=A0ABS0IGI4_9BACT|nr:hypothetical protein [Hymenobacter jeongseonensis]MBF9237471.1 hypothetical protein [Hymenobacter jeongseonensis]
MTILNDWSAADLLDLYKRLEAHVSFNDEPLFTLDFDAGDDGFVSGQNSEGYMIKFTEAEAKLLLFFTGREFHSEMVIHLYSIAGHFRSAAKAKVDEAIPEPPAKWYRYLNAFRTNWTPEDKEKKNGKAKDDELPAQFKPNTIRLGSKVKNSPVPFPKGNMNKHEDPPF